MRKIFILPVLAVLLCSCVCTARKKMEAQNGKYCAAVGESASNVVGGGFIRIDGVWAKYQTEVFAKVTEKGLRFEFDCYGEPSKMLHSGKRADDDMALFGGDHIELVIAPSWDRDKKYYHFAVNPAGSVYHAIGHDTSWNPEGVVYNISDMKDYRKIVLEIPWRTFGLNKKVAEGTIWKVNFCRAAKVKNSATEYSSWTGAQSFHDIKQMGSLVFTEKQNFPMLRILECSSSGSIVESKVGSADNGKYVFQMLCNGQVKIGKELNDKKIVENKFALQNEYVTLKRKEEIILRLIENNSVIWEKSGYMSDESQEFMLPDKFEYLKDSNMKCKISSLPGKFIIKNDSGILRQKNVSGDPAVISLKGLKPGRYVLEYISGGQRSNRVFFIADKFPQSHPALNKNAKITADGTLLRFDNKPFYLLGISGGSKTYFPYSPGFNLQYGSGARPNAPVFQLFPGKRLVRKPETSYAFEYNWQPIVSRYLDAQSKAARNYWRSICYEANIKVSFREKDGSLKFLPDGHKVYGKIYEMAKKAMPDNVFAIHVDNMGVLADYADFCDVLEFASWRSSYNPTNMILHQGEDLDYVRSKAGNKPIVMWLGGSIPNPFCRSAEELRAGVYYTIIKGGAGNIIHMGHGGIGAQRTRFWSMLSMLQSEIDSFYSELSNGRIYKLELPEAFEYKAVVAENGNLLIVVLNKTLSEQKLTLDIEEYGKKTFLFTPFEPRVIRFSKK